MNTAPTTTLPQASPFLNEQQAAARLGLSPKTMKNWRCRGVGPGYLRLGSAVRYHQEALDAWALSKAAA
jgi:predicted DNA-binding transcriptional regulator AlpA